MRALSPPTDDVRIRLWQPGDEETLAALANSRKVWRNLTDRFPHPYTLDDARAWVAVANDSPAFLINYAITVNGQVAGGCSVERMKDLNELTGEIGYWLGEPYWGRGVATRAVRLAVDAVFYYSNMVRLEGAVLGWNQASCRVLEKAGFTREALHRNKGFKDGQVCDIVLFAILRGQ